MFYSKWNSEEDTKTLLKKMSINNIKESGLPLIYENDDIYLLDNSHHNMIIGSQGSGKVQCITLPLMKTSLKAGHSVVVNDDTGELYKHTAAMFEKEDYEIKLINLHDTKYGNNYNPYNLPYKLYKEGNKDKAIELLEEMAHYLLLDENENGDPFWINSAINYFVGISLYLLENNMELNLKELLNVSNKISDEEIVLNDTMNLYLKGIIDAPKETKLSIISVFLQKIKNYLKLESMSNLLSKDDLNIIDTVSKKFVIYIVGGINNISKNITTLLISQLYNTIEIYGNKQNRINFIIQDFDKLIPLKNSYKILTLSRQMNIRFTTTISSFKSLGNLYGDNILEFTRDYFPNLIYLYSNDIDTLNTISDYCGNKDNDNKLINMEELKMFKQFEALMLLMRTMPIKMALTPDYKVDFKIEKELKEMPERK